MKAMHMIATILLVVGGLNWGLVGLADFDLVATIFRDMSALSRIVYSLVGLSGLFLALTWKAAQRRSSLATASR